MVLGRGRCSACKEVINSKVFGWDDGFVVSDDKSQNGHGIPDFYVRPNDLNLLPVGMFECVDKLCRRGRNPLAGANVEVAETELDRGPLF